MVSALSRAVAPTGNVVAPTGTEDNSLTSRAYRARTATMTAAQKLEYREEMRAFDRDTTPSGMGAVSEALRTTAGAVRSAHPQSSFAAIGPDAEYLMADHPLECHLGEDSPLAKLYAMRARVLLMGVGYHSCTAFHLAEYRYKKSPPTQMYSCVTQVNGQAKWADYRDVVLDDGDFIQIGKPLDHRISVKKGHVGNAWSRLVPLVLAVDHARNWMALNRA